MRAIAIALLALFTAGLTGCTTAPSILPAPEASESAASGYAWKPRDPVPRIMMGPEERDELTAKRMETLAEMWKVDNPPKVAVVRWIYPEEVGAVHVACLQEAGYEAKSSGDGRGYTVDFGSLSQQGAFNEARYTCNAMYPTDPRTDSTRWSSAQWTVQYEYLVESLIPCLKRIGANPSEPPTLPLYLADTSSWEYPDPGNSERQDLWWRNCPGDAPSGAVLGEG